MQYLWMALIGLAIGYIAKFLMPGKGPGGCIVTMIVGLAGSVIGWFLGRALGMYGSGDAVGFIMSVVGAMILLFIYRMAIGKQS
jgi:uncharacterized membrane protein YeaQ/YmgE (transglycosylase-associated protein family)